MPVKYKTSNNKKQTNLDYLFEEKPPTEPTKPLKTHTLTFEEFRSRECMKELNQEEIQKLWEIAQKRG